jgi:adenine-specific DNA methylase
MALLLPDPCDSHCPDAFKTDARRILLDHPGRPTKWEKQIADDMGLRKTLLEFIADFANWDHSSDPHYLKTSRVLVKAAHPEETPLVVDPFAGGGSIPLEALRLGCDAFASDLNPVACLILKVMLEDIPRHGPELAAELRRVGAEIKKQAEQELVEFYPSDPDGAKPIAYLWARTVKCESPNCGAEIPLMRSFWLCKKATRKRSLQYRIERPVGKPPSVEFDIFEPKTEKEVPDGTVTRAKATCLCCGTVLPPERVRTQLSEQRGGADVIFDENGNRTGGARLLTVVTLHPGLQGRNYRLPTDRDYRSVWQAQRRLTAIFDEWAHGGKKGHCPVPDEPLPKERQRGNSGFRVLLYGMNNWGSLFAARQKVALVEFSKCVSALSNDSVKELAALSIGRLSDQMSSLVRWLQTIEAVASTFGRQALAMVWDYVEIIPTGSESANFGAAIEWIAKVVEASPLYASCGQIQQADASQSPLPAESVHVWFTDPPYYDAVSYADLADFFFVWLKRTIPNHPLLRDPFDSRNQLTPKTQEAIQDPARIVDGKPKNGEFYEHIMAKAFSEGRRVLLPNGIGSVVFANKTTEGWEALLSGLIRGGWTITGSWPIVTERGVRLVARESAALATSVHLVCRPRQEDALVGDWGDVLGELPGRVGDWMERLQGEGIRGADLVFACIGPALEIFSRYSKVETAEGKEVTLAEYLEKVWEVVGRIALEQVLGTAEALARNGAAGAVEEDARLTALFLWTLQSSNGNGEGKSEKKKGKGEEIEADEGIEDEDEEAAPKSTPKGFSLIFDVVRRFAQPLGIVLPHWEGRIIETKKGVVRLLSLTERAKILFGAAGAHAVADRIERDREGSPQLSLFPEMEIDTVPRIRGRGKSRDTRQVSGVADQALQTKREATTLDRVHAAMLLQSGGRANALRTLLKAEQDRGPDFLRLANALSALYPKGSEEKRLLDAMLLAMPR